MGQEGNHGCSRVNTVRNVCRAFKEVNAFEWEGDYRPAAREALKKILEDEVDKEVEQYLGRAWYERRGEANREDYRNGFRIRHLLTEIGDLVVRMPRTRRKFISRILEAYRRRMRTLDLLILACFVLGMSTLRPSPVLLQKCIQIPVLAISR